MQRRARRHHRIDRIFLLHLEIDQHRTIVRVRRPNRGNHLVALLHHNAA